MPALTKPPELCKNKKETSSSIIARSLTIFVQNAMHYTMMQLGFKRQHLDNARSRWEDTGCLCRQIRCNSWNQRPSYQ